VALDDHIHYRKPINTKLQSSFTSSPRWLQADNHDALSTVRL